MRSIEIVLGLVALATVVATFARRLQVPAPSLLVVAGVAVGFLPGVPDVRVAPDIIGVVVLPPLIYAAGSELSLPDLRRVWGAVALLSVGLVAATAVAVALVGAALGVVAGASAMVLGAILASTDPVAVTALGRRLGLPARVETVVQAESLFNDAVSLILFTVAVGVATSGGGVHWLSATGQFGRLVGIGVVAGFAVGSAATGLRRRTTDPVLGTVVALAAPYAAYVLGQQLHGSGVTAVVVAAVMRSARRSVMASGHSRLHIDAVYATTVFVLESVVFSLIGLQLPTLVRSLPSGTALWPADAEVLVVVLVAVRALWVFPLALRRRASASSPPLSASWRTAVVVSWAGARGVVPLAATLSVPLVTADGRPFPGRALLTLLATAVIVLTLVVQGFTLPVLVRRLGVTAETDGLTNDDDVGRALASAALEALDQRCAEGGRADGRRAERDPAVLRARRELLARVEPIEGEDGEEVSWRQAETAYRSLRRELIVVEGDELRRLLRRGEISERTRHRLQHQLDLEQAALGEH